MEIRLSFLSVSGSKMFLSKMNTGNTGWPVFSASNKP
jgi:hypothetical protein